MKVKSRNRRGQLSGDVGQRRSPSRSLARGSTPPVRCSPSGSREEAAWNSGTSREGTSPVAMKRGGALRRAPVNVRRLDILERRNRPGPLGGDDHKIAIWDRSARAIPWGGLEMATAVSALDYSPRDLLAIGLDGRSRRDLETRATILEDARFQAHASPVKSLAFAP